MTGKTILIVEDEGLIALHMTEMLEKSGYQVSSPANSGEVALRELRQGPLPDLILMDIVLSGKLDGIETALQIRENYPAIHLIFVTAYPPDRTFERIRDIATDGVITKPFCDADLLALIEKAFHR